MRILMLGNSFTFCNEMPKMLEQLLKEKLNDENVEVVPHVRGGAFLAEQLNPDTENGHKTLKSLKEEKWDYVVLQEQSAAPVFHQDAFNESVNKLCELIYENGATPVFYATWAYERTNKYFEDMDLEYDVMFQTLYNAYHEACENNNALIADVGEAFYLNADNVELYSDDKKHPSEAGSKIAAEELAKVILENS